MGAIRLILILVGVFLFLLGIFRAWWEVKAWEVLSMTEQRPPLVGDDPKVEIRLFIWVAAIGAALVAAAVIPGMW